MKNRKKIIVILLIFIIIGAILGIFLKIKMDKKVARTAEIEKIEQEKQKEINKKKEEEEQQRLLEEKARKEEQEQQIKEQERQRQEEERRRAENKNTSPYYIKVSKTHQVVMVYGKDNTGKYTRLIKTFVASTGKDGNTPTGVYKMSKLPTLWSQLYGNVWGKYAIRITGPYWFHSVPYYKAENNQLEWKEYNKLGTPASAGCVRLGAENIKWLYENVPNGTQVEIYDGKLPSVVVKPTTQKISADDPRRGWDPTDPVEGNPWRK